jgi:hypothetical protein
MADKKQKNAVFLKINAVREMLLKKGIFSPPLKNYVLKKKQRDL